MVFTFISALTLLMIGAQSASSNTLSSNTYDINYGALIKIYDVDYFMMQLNKYIENNPHASEDEQNDYIKKEIEKKYKINLSGSYSVQQYSYPDLNPEEQKLFNENPVKGLKALYEGKKAIDEAFNRSRVGHATTETVMPFDMRTGMRDGQAY